MSLRLENSKNPVIVQKTISVNKMDGLFLIHRDIQYYVDCVVRSREKIVL